MGGLDIVLRALRGTRALAGRAAPRPEDAVAEELRPAGGEARNSPSRQMLEAIWAAASAGACDYPAWLIAAIEDHERSKSSARRV
jgi:hypothetical protein